MDGADRRSRVAAALALTADVDAVAVVHHETTTGLLNPLAEIAAAAAEAGVRAVVDAISSFGVEEIALDGGIDLLTCSSNKCLHGLPGAAFVLVSPAGRGARAASIRPRSPSTSARISTARRAGSLPFTPAIPALAALDAALDRALAEGVAGAARAVRGALRAPRRRVRSGSAWSSWLRRTRGRTPSARCACPEGVSFAALHERLRRDGYVIYAGQGPLASQIFRVSCMGALELDDLRRFVGRARARARRASRVTAGRGERARLAAPVARRPSSSASTASTRDYLDDALRAEARRRACRARRAGRLCRRPLADAELHEPEQRLDRDRGVRRPCTASRATTTSADDGNEVQLTDPSFLRAPTIHAAFDDAGVPVLAVTTKDKLRRLLAAPAACRASRPSAPTLHDVSAGRDACPSSSSRPEPGDLRLGLLALRARARPRARRQRLGSAAHLRLADRLRAARARRRDGESSDRYLARSRRARRRLPRRGLRRRARRRPRHERQDAPDGSPNVRYLGDVLDGAGVRGAHVVLPITDPLRRAPRRARLVRAGSTCRAAERERGARRARGAAGGRGRARPRAGGAPAVAAGRPHRRPRGARRTARPCSAARASEHDLSALRGPLRSHGGRHEQAVPILLSGADDGAARRGAHERRRPRPPAERA